MIVSPIPGQTPDRSSEHTLQGLASNLNAYAEQWTQIITAGTTVDLTPAQVIAKNLRLDAGASGAFTIQLPPTSKIIDALGATVSVDGSYWFPLYIYNNSVGQTGTLVAGDADTTIDALNASVADGHVTKWMVNVEAAPNNSTPITLNFHNAWTACCSGVQPQTCPPDLPPVLLIFGIAPNPNEVLQYDVTQPGVVKARLLSAGFLGSGTITYAPTTFDSTGPSAIYNVRDGLMYFTATKTDSVGPVVTDVLVQFDPRTLAITGEILLPSNSYTLIDVADQSAWLTFGDGTAREFDLVSKTEIFNDATALTGLGYSVFPAGIACNSGQLLLAGLTSTTLALVTVTGASTFVITTITVPTQPDFAENGPLRRRWVMDRNKVILPSSGNPTYLVDLNDLSFQVAYAETANTFAPGPGPFWDAYLHLLVGTTTGSGDFGLFIGDDTGGTVGIAGLNNGDWGPLGGAAVPQTSGGLALAQSNIIDALGGFDETAISTTPSEIYQRTDGFTFPNGQTFDAGNLCVALRRKDCLPIEAPQRGSNLAFSSTGGQVAFFQTENTLVGVDGASDSFTTADAKTVTVTNGIITSIV